MKKQKFFAKEDMGSPVRRTYNIFQCPTCKCMQWRYDRVKGQVGVCTVKGGKREPVLYGLVDSLLEPVECPDYAFSGGRIK